MKRGTRGAAASSGVARRPSSANLEFFFYEQSDLYIPNRDHAKFFGASFRSVTWPKSRRVAAPFPAAHAFWPSSSRSLPSRLSLSLLSFSRLPWEKERKRGCSLSDGKGTIGKLTTPRALTPDSRGRFSVRSFVKSLSSSSRDSRRVFSYRPLPSRPLHTPRWPPSSSSSRLSRVPPPFSVPLSLYPHLPPTLCPPVSVRLRQPAVTRPLSFSPNHRQRALTLELRIGDWRRDRSIIYNR